MSVPKSKRTSSSKRRRASHFALNKTQTCVCPQCKKTILPHCACPWCGCYKGREVIKIKTNKKKIEDKKKG